MINFFPVARLEEKESELKREYSRLHDRYTELFKTHVDYMERTKILVGSSERLENSSIASNRNANRLSATFGMAPGFSRSSGPLSYGFQSLEASIIDVQDIREDSPPSIASIKTELLDDNSEAAMEISEKSAAPDNASKESKTVCSSASKFFSRKFSSFH